MLGIGVFFFFKERGAGEKEYFLGGRSMGPWVTAMSAQASDMSAWLLMGLPGSILAFGFGQIWIGIGLAIGTAPELDLGCAAAALLLRGGEGLHHASAVSLEPFCDEEPCLADHLRGHLPRVLHDLCGVGVRLRRDGVHDGLPPAYQIRRQC